jgi:hypothetical protein
MSKQEDGASKEVRGILQAKGSEHLRGQWT